MIAIVVSCCAECSFVVADIDDRGEPWLCDALGDDAPDGVPREIPEQRVVDGEWPDPPDWCPLREADRLVMLRLRSKT